MKALLLIMALQFSKPIDFTEALQSREVRSVLPTTLSSAEIREAIDQQLLVRSTLSARVTSVEYLQEINDLTAQRVNGEIDDATMRTQLKAKLQELRYQPDPDERGKITDFGSESRLRVVIETNAQLAQGYGQFLQGQDVDVLDSFPAQELFRLKSRKKQRSWESRWSQVGGHITEGRMIARKDDPIWKALGTRFSDSLGNPFPPFAFNSGMWVKDVSRDEAVRLKIIDRDAQVKPAVDVDFNADLKWTPKVRSEALLQALKESIGPDFQVKDGVLTRAD